MDRRSFLKLTGLLAISPVTCTSMPANCKTNTTFSRNNSCHATIDSVSKLVAHIKPGSLTLAAGRPALGKTTLAVSIGKYFQDHEKKSAMYISADDRRLSESKRQYISDVLDQYMFLHPDILAVEYIYHDQKFTCIAPEILVIDDVVKLNEHPESQKAANGVLNWAKDMAINLNMAVVLTTGVKREVCDRDDHRPRIGDLLISNSYPVQADTVILLYRDEIYHPESEWPGITEATVIKPGSRHHNRYYLAMDYDAVIRQGRYRT